MSDYYTNNDDINTYENLDSAGRSDDYYANTGQQNDYYTNLDPSDDYYAATDGISEDDLVNKNFVIEVNTTKKIIHFIGVLMPFAFYLMLYGFIKSIGDYGNIVSFMLFAMFMLFAGFFVINVGKKIEIIDKTIIITRFFYRKEIISIKDITKCEVITGLSSHGRYRTVYYNKVVIYYAAGGKDRKVDMTDDLYTGYNELVRYMDYFVKCDFLDGRTFFSSFFDNDR